MLGFMICVCWLGLWFVFRGKRKRPPDRWDRTGAGLGLRGGPRDGALEASEPAANPQKGGRGSGTDYDPSMTFGYFQQKADDTHDEDHFKDGAGSHGDGGCCYGSGGLDDGRAAGPVAGNPMGKAEPLVAAELAAAWDPEMRRKVWDLSCRSRGPCGPPGVFSKWRIAALDRRDRSTEPVARIGFRHPPLD